MGTFKRDLEFGQRKEEVVKNILKIAYDINSDIDNSTHDHDIKVNEFCFIEVKADSFMRKTNNVLFELYSDADIKKEGWLQYSDCDILVYCANYDDEIKKTSYAVFYDFKPLREYIKMRFFNGDFNNIDFYTKTRYRTHSKDKALNILIPQKDLTKFIISIYSTDEKRELYSRESLKDFCLLCEIFG